MDNLTLIRNAGERLKELDAAKTEEQRLDLEIKQQKKCLDAELQMVSDAVHRTVSARRAEIEENYQKETAKVQERQKKARSERNKAKVAGVKNRIEEETADLREENRRLSREMKSRMKQDKVPGFCNTTYYYALYFTKGIKETLILLITFLVTFLVLPCGVYLLIPEHRAWYLIIIYLIAMLLFFGLYIIVGNITKEKYMNTLREGRKSRNMIANNQRRIRAIRRSIEKDQNEEIYRLDDYDQRLDQLKQEFREIESRREDALHQFEQVTALEIEQEIQENSREKIESLKQRITEATAAHEEKTASIQSLNLTVTDEYVPYLGKEFMEAEALKGLEELLTKGEATTLTEAKTLYLERHGA